MTDSLTLKHVIRGSINSFNEFSSKPILGGQEEHDQRSVLKKTGIFKTNLLLSILVV